ncbi:MAG: class I SAM-dependent methyltransferase [Fibrobacter sp.]|nr:class I SAM-dependent methyltransferase [Fibrobacter sp.]
MNRARNFWDKQAKRFDDNERQFETASGEIISRTKEYLNADDNVLDFGCATGTKTLELAGIIKHIHGLDFSSEMIREAIRKKNKVKATNVSFSQGTIFSDDLDKAFFDKIIAFSIIHLLEDSEKVIQRIYELLKPGGLLITETACFSDRMNFKTRLEFTASRFMKLLKLFPLNMNMFKTTDVEQLISRQDFNILKSERLFFNGMTISFIVAEKD